MFVAHGRCRGRRDGRKGADWQWCQHEPTAIRSLQDDAESTADKLCRKLLLTNGKKAPAVGRTKLRVKVGSINDELPVLVLNEKSPELIIGSRTREEFRGSLEFDSNQFGNRKGEGSAVPVEMVPLQHPTCLEKSQTATEADDGQRQDQTRLAECLSAPAHATRGAQHYAFKQ